MMRWTNFTAALGIMACMMPPVFSDEPEAPRQKAPAAESTETPFGLASGALVIVGGGKVTSNILERFIQLAGGPDSRIVVLPTAGSADEYPQDWGGLIGLKEAGAKNLTVLHTRDRKVADSEEFVQPLEKAGGVWISGGRQSRLVEAYVDTRTHKTLFGVLKRGGVIGGTSAGASIQGSYAIFPRRGTLNYAPGFNLMRNVAIDQHLLARNRENDLVGVVKEHPHMLGIGIDECTAVVVQQNSFDVIGTSKVAIYDPQHKHADDKHYYFLEPGSRFNLGTRLGEIPPQVAAEPSAPRK